MEPKRYAIDPLRRVGASQSYMTPTEEIHPSLVRSNGDLLTIAKSAQGATRHLSPNDDIHQIAREALKTGDATGLAAMVDAIREAGHDSSEDGYYHNLLQAKLVGLGYPADDIHNAVWYAHYPHGSNDSDEVMAARLRSYLEAPHGIRISRGRLYVNKPRGGSRKKIVVDELPPAPSRMGRKRYAKVDGDVPAHPLIAGFPLEHVLRHLANDPKNGDDLRGVAKSALTGEQGDPSAALWALNDVIREHHDELGNPHPLRDAYNWMSAADKIHLDKHTRTAMEEAAAARRKRDNVGEEDGRFQYKPESVAIRASHTLNGEDPTNEELNTLRKRIKTLAKEDDQDRIDESIRRHAHRGFSLHNEQLREYHKKQAIRPLTQFETEVLGKAEEKATRYARLRLGDSRPFRGPLGESMTEHDYHDVDTGKKLGVVRVQPRNDGQHLHVHWLGPTDRSAGEVANTVGAEGMVSLKRELKSAYPSAEFISGVRAGGFRSNPERVVKKLTRRRYAKTHIRDFFDALRQIRSSNQAALHEVANRLSHQLHLHPTVVMDALHDTPSGSVPGIAAAVYGTPRPEAVHQAAAWVGLTANLPGVAVFHARDVGPDRLYRMRQEGSGLDIRQKLDRFGIKERVLIPNRKGFDVVIPDLGGRLGPMVQQYATAMGLSLESSPGHFKTVGSADQAQARDKYRVAVVRGESKPMKRSGTPKKYMTGPQDTLKALQAPEYAHHMAGLDNPLTGLRGVAADHLDEQDRTQEAEWLRTPGLHVTIHQGRVLPNYMERQEYGSTYGLRDREQFVKPTYYYANDDPEEKPHHSMTYWFAENGTPQVHSPTGGLMDDPEYAGKSVWWWNPADGDGFDDEDILKHHPDYENYQRTDELGGQRETVLLTPAEIAWMHHHAQTPEFKMSRRRSVAEVERMTRHTPARVRLARRVAAPSIKRVLSCLS